MRFFQSIALLASLAFAKEVASPITSFAVGQANDISNKEGYTGSAWQLDYKFALSPEADDVQPGDHFNFDIDDNMSLDAGNYDFMVKDPHGNDIMRITNSGHHFTATYSDFVASKNYQITGKFFMQSTLNSAVVKGPGPLTITTTTGGQTFSEEIEVEAALSNSSAYKFAERVGNRIQWTIQVPASPYDRMKVVDKLTDAASSYSSPEALLQDMTLNFFSHLTPNWDYENLEKITDVSQYVQLVDFNSDGFTMHLVNIPEDDVTVQIQFYSDINYKQDQYTNNMNWLQWNQGYGHLPESAAEDANNDGSGVIDNGMFKGGSAYGGAPYDAQTGGNDLNAGGEGDGEGRTKTTSSVEPTPEPTSEEASSTEASSTVESSAEPTSTEVSSSEEPTSTMESTTSGEYHTTH